MATCQVVGIRLYCCGIFIYLFFFGRLERPIHCPGWRESEYFFELFDPGLTSTLILFPDMLADLLLHICFVQLWHPYKKINLILNVCKHLLDLKVFFLSE